MSTFRLLHSATPTRHSSTLTSPSHATPSRLTRSVSCGGCSHVKCCVFVDKFHVRLHGTSWLTCSSTVTQRRLRRRSRQLRRACQHRKRWPLGLSVFTHRRCSVRVGGLRLFAYFTFIHISSHVRFHCRPIISFPNSAKRSMVTPMCGSYSIVIVDANFTYALIRYAQLPSAINFVLEL